MVSMGCNRYVVAAHGFGSATQNEEAKMVSIKISGRKVTISDALREQVETKIGGALKVFDIKPMTCDVVLRVDKNHSYGKRNACEVTVFVRDNVVRVVATEIGRAHV